MQAQCVEQIRAIVKCNCISNQLERLTINMAFNKCTNLQLTPIRNEYFTELVTELIPIRSGTHGHVSTSSYELLSAPWVNKLQITIL